MTDDPLLTVNQVAERVSIDAETIRRWLRSGRLPGYRPGGTKAGWRVRASELEQFIASSRAGASGAEVAS